MGNPKIQPPPYKIGYIITKLNKTQLCMGNYVGETCHTKNFTTIHSGVAEPHTSEIVFTRLHFFICGLFLLTNAETVAPILMLNTSNGVVPHKAALWRSC